MSEGKALIRGRVSLVILLAISLLLTQQRKALDQVRGSFLTGLLVAIVAAASVIYEMAVWPLRKQLLVCLKGLAR